jgi:peptidoglycan/xylan/chitin deacetylase (PgdA/CDA1 family)
VDRARLSFSVSSTVKTQLHLSAALLATSALACAPVDTARYEPPAGGAGGADAVGAAGSTGTAGSSAGSGPDAGGSSGGTTQNPATGGSGGSGGTDSVGPGTNGLPASGTLELPVPPTTGVARPSGAVGGLRVLDWAGFSAAITYTFDDANTSQISNYDALQALGVPFTFYLWTSRPGATSNVWRTAVTDGHELGNHTQSHLQGSSPGLAADTDAAELFIQNTFGVAAYTMAAPYGASQYVDIARTRYLLNRGINDTMVMPTGTTDRLSVPTVIPPQGADAEELNRHTDAARSSGGWKSILIHGFTGDGGAYQPVDFAEFVASVEYTKAFGDVWIGTLLDIGTYWVAQRAIRETAPVVEGSSTTWNWVLPDHFPPNRTVRVTVTGGTLLQVGVPLTWDEHGYYEVALDAGSLTLSP